MKNTNQVSFGDHDSDDDDNSNNYGLIESCHQTKIRSGIWEAYSKDLKEHHRY